MVTDSRIDAPASETVKKTVKSLKEIFKDHSEEDIYAALKEANMDLSETTNKLIHQDTFHEVKRRRDRKKEGVGYKDSGDPRKHSENVAQGMKGRAHPDRVDCLENVAQGMKGRAHPDRVDRSENVVQRMKVRAHPDRVDRSENVVQRMKVRAHPDRVDRSENVVCGMEVCAYPDRLDQSENAVKGMKVRAYPDHVDRSENGVKETKVRAYPDRVDRRGGFNRNHFPGRITREFRVVRDNRLNQNIDTEMKPPSQCSTSTSEQVVGNVTKEGSMGNETNQRPSSSSRSSSQASNALSNSQPRHSRNANFNGTLRKETLDEKRTLTSKTSSWSQAVKPNNFPSNSTVQSLSSSVVGVYSSSTDPVHVPSPELRPLNAVGVVGVRRQPSKNTAKDSSPPSSSLSNPLLGDKPSESVRHVPTISKADQRGQSTTSESVIPSMSGSRTLLSNQHVNRPHHQNVGQQKGAQHKIEWKPKPNQKLNTNNPGVIGTPKKSALPPVNDAKDIESEKAKLQDDLSQVKLYDRENVIIAQHIRVPENDRFQLTFGSFGVELDSSRSGGVVEATNGESASSPSVSSPETSPVDNLDDQVRSSRSGSPSPGDSLEHVPDKRDTSSPQNIANYADIGLIQDDSYARPESQQPQVPPELPGFSAYDLQTGYDIPQYLRPTMDDTARGQSLQSQEVQLQALNSHGANIISPSTIAMVQQQQPQVTQMYPPVHVSHYANLMPYRQFLSPVYVQQMAMPGYSSNPAYAHPSSGSTYMLMPGGSSPLNANALKYGIQQFKPVPAASPSGFSNFTSPTGYAINAPGVIGNANGLEDSSRIKYKDGNMFVPNQQADASDLWFQNPRELQGLQSAPYYNVPGQTPHGAYLPSHSGHPSFNAAAAQSSHMQFSGLYHSPPQAAAMGNPHHLGPAMGATVGVAPAAPGAQVGPYQQPQLGHLNWPANF